MRLATQNNNKRTGTLNGSSVSEFSSLDISYSQAGSAARLGKGWGANSSHKALRHDRVPKKGAGSRGNPGKPVGVLPPQHPETPSFPPARSPLMIIDALRAAVVSWRRREEFQSLCLTHTLRQPLRFGQLPNQPCLQSTVPASAQINVLQQLANGADGRELA
jgi:hypothetical protein